MPTNQLICTTNMILSHYMHRLWGLQRRKVLKSILHCNWEIFISLGNSSALVMLSQFRATVVTLWHCLWTCYGAKFCKELFAELTTPQPQRLLWPKAGVIFYPQLKQRQKEYRDQVEKVWSTEFFMLNLKIHDRPKIFIIIMFAPKLP